MKTPRRTLGAALQLVAGPALAQYAPAPGIRDSLIPAVVVPWVVLLLCVVWSLTKQASPFRSLVLQPIAGSACGFLSIAAVLVILLGVSTGPFREMVAVFCFYLVIFSGPLVFTLSLVIAAITYAARRRGPPVKNVAQRAE